MLGADVEKGMAACFSILVTQSVSIRGVNAK